MCGRVNDLQRRGAHRRGIFGNPAPQFAPNLGCTHRSALAQPLQQRRQPTVLDGLGGTFRPLSDTTQMTFPSDKPSIRIDYILGRGLPESAVVTERQVDTSTVASDHCPLWVSLAWKK